MVVIGYTEPTTEPAEPDQQLRDNRKRDAKALLFIQGVLDDSIFPRISSASSSKEAWEILKMEYHGDSKVISVKLQTLRGTFESLKMKKHEPVQDYLSRVSAIVNQMKSYGEIISDQNVVARVLRSLTKDYIHVVAAIEKSKTMSTYTFDELMGSLLAHEDRMNRHQEKEEETTFSVSTDSSNKWNNDGRGNSRGGYRGRGRGRGRGGGRSQFAGECHYCKKYGHKEAECWSKQRSEEKKVNFTEQAEEDDRLFMAHSTVGDASQEVW
ncbi:uncharacterized protein LOC125498856 [Beta vulgaris subsp. vulgaris]|uniref:uncharacterized protein LOC125498856 n=1 Tax=Beta vulgaris subsp. vulgaris TaxID=3555 RepID=UPI002036D9D0|nr:uncharacterized protein LOC125498856 [Beta vulgaris subsp. vulgaris]